MHMGKTRGFNQQELTKHNKKQLFVNPVKAKAGLNTCRTAPTPRHLTVTSCLVFDNSSNWETERTGAFFCQENAKTLSFETTQHIRHIRRIHSETLTMSHSDAQYFPRLSETSPAAAPRMVLASTFSAWHGITWNHMESSRIIQNWLGEFGDRRAV